MEFNPSSTTISLAFSEKEDFFIPRYQRSYAWDESELSAFYSDLSSLFDARKAGEETQHFFGGFLVIQHKVAGSRRRQWEIVDGQQRMTSFSILGLAIIEKIKKVLLEAGRECDPLHSTIQEILDREEVKWDRFNDIVNRTKESVSKLRLSRADETYYRDLVRLGSKNLPKADARSSHKRLYESYLKAVDFVNQKVVGESVSEQYDNLSILNDVLADDCQVLWIDCSTKEDAYRIFQVLNDRGTGLSDGDLLRNSTLEAISTHGKKYLEEAGRIWDDILKDDYTDQEKLLRWYYTSVIGSAPTSGNVHSHYL